MKTTLAILAALCLIPLSAHADDAADGEWSLHGQSTFTEQYHPAFHSPYQGTNSLSGGNQGRETLDATLYGGLRLWNGAEVWINPEVDQGYGLSHGVGVAGYTSGEAFTFGDASPYVRVQRAFIRQTINLGGATTKIDPDANQFSGEASANRVVFTAGKFSITDIFDNNQYSHDPRVDFLNNAVSEMGSFDYAGDSWGYTDGASIEGYWSRFALRAGYFAVPNPNSAAMVQTNFSQYQLPVELEEDHTFRGQPGKLRALIFFTHAHLGTYNEATQVGLATASTPDTSAVRSPHTKIGGGLNLEQQLTDTLGAFARIGYTQGKYEADGFTDINEAVSFGLSLNGAQWQRPKDTVGLGFAISDISHQAKEYFAAGGLGLEIGDGQLPSAGTEQIMETYYSFSVTDYAKVSADYQFLNNPGYNTQRGPVSVFGLRGHIQF